MAALDDDKFYKMVVPRAEMNSREIELNMNRRPPVPAQKRQNAGLGLDTRYWLPAERWHLLLKEGKRLTDRLAENQDHAPGPAVETTKHY